MNNLVRYLHKHPVVALAVIATGVMFVFNATNNLTAHNR